jgi:SAM-dependent methyltransferase
MTSPAVELGAWLRRLPHYLYLVDLLPGKRVLEVGCGVGFGAQFLANHGAGRVVGVDRSLRRVTEARARHRQTNLEFRCEEPGSIELEDGSFDCIFVPEGVDLLRRRSVLAELRRLLVRQGHLVLCGGSADRRGAPGGASFYEFRERLERLFAPVRMIAQTPFVGFSLIEYGDDAGSPGIELDTSLLELSGGEPEPCDYVAVCGGSAGSLRGFTVVQVPDRDGVGAVARAVSGAEPVVNDRAEPEPRGGESVVARELRNRLETAVEDRSRAEAMVDDLRIQVDDLRMQLVDLRAATRDDSAEPAPPPVATTSEQIAEALSAHREVVRSLEIAVEEGQVYADELRAELEQAQASGEAGERARRRAEERAQRFEAELREWRTRASVAEGKLMRAAAGGNGVARLTELEQELARLQTSVRDKEAAARAAAQAASRAERERDEMAARLRQVDRPARSGQGGGEVAARLAHLEGELGTGRDLLRQIEEGLSALEREAARESLDRAPTGWAAHRDEQLRELSAELGVKDAEITILHVGVTALRARMKELIGEVRRAAASMRGRSAAEMLDVIDRLSERLATFEERD